MVNFIIDGYDSKKCKTSNSASGGETKTITKLKGKALGDGDPVVVFDIPELSDPDLPSTEWSKIIQENLEGKKGDMALVVIKATDYRTDLH